MKTVWYESNASPTTAYPSPLESGVFHMPAGAVDVEPPPFDPETERCSWIGDKWIVENLTAEVAPEVEWQQTPMEQLRLERDRKLVESDWWMLLDTEDASQEQLDYRQALRDLPASASPTLDEAGELAGVIFPEKPE
jgi:hypothetical protein